MAKQTALSPTSEPASQATLLSSLDAPAAAALNRVLDEARRRGFRFCHLFPLGPAIFELHPFPKLGVVQPLGLLLGNDATLWPLFEASLAHFELEHPLDAYVVEATQSCVSVAEMHGLTTEVFYGFKADYAGHLGQPTAIPLQRLAQRSGFAALGPAQLCAHLEVGPWFALRALLVVGIETAHLQELPPAAAPCAGCAAPCLSKYEEARRITADAQANVTASLQNSSSPSLNVALAPWVAVRDACPVGREHRYSDAQISFHYSGAFRSLLKART